MGQRCLGSLHARHLTLQGMKWITASTGGIDRLALPCPCITWLLGSGDWADLRTDLPAFCARTLICLAMLHRTALGLGVAQQVEMPCCTSNAPYSPFI